MLNVALALLLPGNDNRQAMFLTEPVRGTANLIVTALVGAPTADVALDALFDSITVPGTITNEQLATIEGMTITVNAYAIQADGFANAEAAWAAFN